MDITLLCADPQELLAVQAQLCTRLPLRVGDAKLAGAPQWIWWHEGSCAATEGGVEAERAIARRIKEHLDRGGRVLVSGALARHVDLLAGETALPVLRATSRTISSRPALARGLQALPREPLFARCGPRVMLSRRRGAGSSRAAIFPTGQRPAMGRLLAIECTGKWSGAARGALWAYTQGRGRLLCLGAHLVFAGEDEHCEARARFCGDMFDWLANDPAQRRTCGWPAAEPSVRFAVDEPRPGPEPELALAMPAAASEPDPMKAVVPGSGSWSCDLWAGNGMAFQSDSQLDRMDVRVPGFATATLSTAIGEVADGVGPMPPPGIGPCTVETVRIGPSQIEAILVRRDVCVRQRIEASADGFVVAFANVSRTAARLALSTELTAGQSEDLPGSVALDVGASVAGRRLRISCEAVESAHEFDYSMVPILRGVSDRSGSAASVAVRREFELPPGAELRIRCAGSRPDLRSELLLQGRASLALGAHDESHDEALRWIVAKAERSPVSVPTACLLGKAEAMATRLEELLRTRGDAEVREVVDATLFLAAWRGDGGLPGSLWLALRSVVLVCLARGPDSMDRAAWLGCSLLAIRSGDPGLGRLCSAAAAKTPCAVSELALPHDWRARIATIGEALHSTRVDEFLRIVMTEVLGARVARDRLAVELLPSRGPWDRFAFAGLRLLGHELSGDLAWEPDGRAFRATFLASRESRTPSALEFDLAPLFPGEAENVEVVVDGLPVVPAREPEEGGTRVRVRCRIPDAIEVFFRLF